MRLDSTASDEVNREHRQRKTSESDAETIRDRCGVSRGIAHNADPLRASGQPNHSVKSGAFA